MRKFTSAELRTQRELQLNNMLDVYNQFNPATEDMNDVTSVQMSANELSVCIEVFEELLNKKESEPQSPKDA